MITLTGKCMLLEGVLRLLSTAKAIDFLHLMTGLRKRWPSMRLHQRVNGDTGTGGPKGIWCWMGHISDSQEQVHLLAMPGHIAWVQDHLIWWAQWLWLLVHLIVGKVPVANWAQWTPSYQLKKLLGDHWSRMKDEKNINPLFASSLPYIYVLVVFRLLNHLTSKNEVMTFLSIVVFFFFFDK